MKKKVNKKLIIALLTMAISAISLIENEETREMITELVNQIINTINQLP